MSSSSNTAKGLLEIMATEAKIEDANKLQYFFKTSNGQYGAGDVFIGLRVPHIRALCKQFSNLALDQVQDLLNSPIHEARLGGLIILVDQYKKSTFDGVKQAIYDLYIKNIHLGRINNWDLVDSSAEFIIGPWLKNRPKDILFELAVDGNIWARRASILAAFDYVKAGDAGITLKLAEVLLQDKEDLIRKAVGWQLREVGKRVNRQLLLSFLDKHAASMPRTTLRYAIEHLSSDQKRHYMHLKFN